ncbi:CHASE3 domain-containing protein [Candidatus Viadribacter manganicus]|uniref:CHASE3 domain-containing protein n=1 Tax=Candidatus Viadribacter manganicus TaxID=1759059 RepID=UPI000AA0D88F|nr:CHASE3 domain-containing protein [Candidatus Viadribacter manganicus]
MTVNVLGRQLPAAATYVAALSAALLLLVITVVAALWQTEQTTQLNADVRQSLAQRSSLRLLMRGVQDAETGQRGYLLTGNENYLDPYFAGRSDIEREIANIETYAGQNPERVAEARRMRELVSSKLEELQTTIDLRREGRGNLAMARVRDGRGKLVMDEFRALIAAAEAREQAGVIEAMAAVDRGATRLRFVIIIAGLLLLGVAALLVVTVRNAMSELRVSRDEARSAHERVLQEMGAREQAEEKVRQMQKMEAIGQLTGGVAHDFNNMLAVIISSLQLAQRRLARGDTDIARFADAAMDGARRAATLTNRLLAFARRQPLQPQVLDVNRVIAGMSDLLRRTLGESISLEIVLGGGAWRSHADQSELENAILNACVNARDAMPEGGKLTIETSNVFLDEAYAAANAEVTPGQHVMIAITDTGGGMSPEVRARVFEPFYTTKEVGKGTGLGLAHVHGFLKQSGGHVAIYSEVGVGTTVKFYLPRTQMEESEDQVVRTESKDLPMGDAATIVLVVEDEERVRNLSVASLRELGYTVVHASSGEEALLKLEAKPAVTLLFTDIVMPGMSGRKLSDEAKARYPELKVLYTTGYTQNAIVHNGVVDAHARLLLKPYSIDDLARKVRAVLDE